MGTKPNDSLEAARKLLTAMMAEATKRDSTVDMDTKLKILDRSIKIAALDQRKAMGGMGRGFDAEPDEEL